MGSKAERDSAVQTVEPMVPGSRPRSPPSLMIFSSDHINNESFILILTFTCYIMPLAEFTSVTIS